MYGYIVNSRNRLEDCQNQSNFSVTETAMS